MQDCMFFLCHIVKKYDGEKYDNAYQDYPNHFGCHDYSLFIIIGIFLAIWLGNKRWIERGGKLGQVSDVAIFAVPFGIIGGRIYHVATDWEKYFGANQNWVEALKIWNGGLGIWGAISLGLLGAYLRYRTLRRRLDLPSFAVFVDALAPGILFAQAIGRFGNWFNGELFGRPLDAPWALSIPLELRPVGYEEFVTFHPTFLYESLWCIVIALLLIYVTPKFSGGAIFALYVAGYSAGRFFIEGLRIDQAHTFGALRLNQYVAALIFIIFYIF